MGLLSNQQITAIFNAAVSSGLFEDRSALFAGIPPAIWGAYPTAAAKNSQIKVDLGQLNRVTPIGDGSYPLRTWLRNAWDLTRDANEGKVFREGIVALDRVIAAKDGATDTAIDLAGALAPWTQEEVHEFMAGRLTARAATSGTTKDPLDLVRAASAGSWLDWLLLAALSQQPDDPSLVGLAEARKLIPAVPLAASALQRIVREKTPFSDVALWRARLAAAEAAVARVEFNVDGMWKANGTAFLVGPDMLMTNQHVVEPLLGQRSVLGKLRFRFDFKRITDGARPLDGTLVDPAQKDWCGPHAPPSAVDEMPNPGRDPTAEELDFAIIRLASKVGDLAVGASGTSAGGKHRGWLEPVKDPALTCLAAGENVFILEHPDGDALQIAAGMFLEVGARRVRYDANAVSGSSGSPVFDARLDVVALHQAGDPNFASVRRPTYNQGIPMHLIVARCNAEGLSFPPRPP